MKTARDRPRRRSATEVALLAGCAFAGCALAPSGAFDVATGAGGADPRQAADAGAARVDEAPRPPLPPNRNDLLCAPGVDEDVPLPPQPCPSEMAQIGRYCIDRWEAHLVERDAQGTQRPHPYDLRPRDGVAYEARSAPGVYPQGYISRVEAQAACEVAGKRLCTWIEWRRACQGPHWWTYPYGWRYRAGACNHYKEHLLGLLFGEDPSRWKREIFDDPRLAQEPGFLARTGEHQDCVSPDGIYDAVGNLHEWVVDRVTARFVRGLAAEPFYRRTQPWREGNGMFLGGFYSTRRQHGPGCHYTTVAHGPSYHDYSTGFRCCRDARSEEER